MKFFNAHVGGKAGGRGVADLFRSGSALDANSYVLIETLWRVSRL